MSTRIARALGVLMVLASCAVSASALTLCLRYILSKGN